MKNRQKKLLLFPKPPQEPDASTIVFQVGNDRFAVRLKCEIEQLPPAAPLIGSKPRTKQDTEIAK